MIIQGYSTLAQPFLNGAINPAFFGAHTQGSGPTTKDVVVTYPPYQVMLKPASIYQKIDGVDVRVDFDPVSVTVAPPPRTVQVTLPGSTTLHSDFECVGVVSGSPQKLVALIRPNVVAGAHHYPLAPGDTVTFYGSAGATSAKVTGVARTFGDLETYYLDRAITEVKPANLMGSQPTGFYAGRALASFGLVGSRLRQPFDWTPAVMAMQLNRVAVETGGNWAGTVTPINMQNYMEWGDSGAPQFMLYNGLYYYVGSNRKIGSVLVVNVVAPWVDPINSL